MPGYIIHLAIGKVYSQNYKIENLDGFEKGIVAPDIIKDKQQSHYGPNSSNPGLSKFIQINGIWDSYNEGYFLHLVTDYLFYNKFLKRWDSSIYNDYNKLNGKLIKKYKIKIPKAIEKEVKFINGSLSVLDEKKICHFIDFVGKLNLRQIALKKYISYESKINEVKIEYDQM